MNNLPNQKNTWKPLKITSYEEWIKKRSGKYINQDTSIVAYIDQQIHALEGETDLKSITLQGARLKELTYAKLHYHLTYDLSLCNKIIRGQRLCTQLHEDYVKESKCYSS